MKTYEVKTPILNKAAKALETAINSLQGRVSAAGDEFNTADINALIRAAGTTPRVVATDLKVRLTAPRLDEIEATVPRAAAA